MRLKGRVGFTFLLFFIFIAFSLITRTVLLFAAAPAMDLSLPLLAYIYIVGLFFDCVTFSYLAIPLLLYAIFAPNRIFNSRPVAWLMLFVTCYALIFNLVAEYFFFAEFASRYNFVAIDYLVYTTEVIRNIRESYPINGILVVIFVLSLLLVWLLNKKLSAILTDTSTLTHRLKRGAILAVLPLLSYVFVDLTVFSIATDNYATELSKNGLYNLVAAFVNNELDYNRFYATRDTNLVLGRLRQLAQEQGNHYVSSDSRDLTRVIHHEGAGRRLNVIVVVEESMSGDYLAAFGNKENLTPNHDRLASESLFFTNLYATGTRTVRGLEAVSLAIPPLPGTSLIKRPNNEHLFSWGTLMRKKRYDTRFIYGGHGYFDNMNYFFLHNGFDIVDETDFDRDEITFGNAWGVCDEDLFRKVIKESNRSYVSGRPFFNVVMTTSNHRPFTYPGGKIDIPSKTGRNGAVKYADYAIGAFLKQAKLQPWFNNTIFVFVADHCAGSARKMALPPKNYQIPLLIYSPANIRPQRIDTLCSQIDVAPTVLGLLNFSYETKFLGKDILRLDSSQGRAFISTYEKLGYLKDNAMVVLSPKKIVEYFRFDRFTGTTTAIPPSDSLLLDALAYYQGTNDNYKHKRIGAFSAGQ